MSKQNTARIMAICPSSTPTLNDSIEVKNLLRGNPISLSELAKPKPCIKPNEKTSAIRQGLSSVISIFSMATNKIDKAIIGSTTALGAMIMLFILNASVIEWAIVNAVACHKIDFTFWFSKHSPTTNKIWSKPCGMMWLKPSFK